MQLPVRLASWEIECCADPPSVGSAVAWQLVFTEAEDAQGGHDVLRSTFTAQPCEDGDTSVGWPVRLSTAGLTMYWDAPRAIAGMLSISGHVRADFHGDVPDGFPATVGTVCSVEIEYRQDGENAVRSPLFRPVHSSPKWFSREQAGVLVALKVSDD